MLSSCRASAVVRRHAPCRCRRSAWNATHPRCRVWCYRCRHPSTGRSPPLLAPSPFPALDSWPVSAQCVQAGRDIRAPGDGTLASADRVVRGGGMNVVPPPGGAMRADTTHRTCLIDIDDYRELIKIAQDHAALLKMTFKHHPNADKFRQAYWSRRICLSTEEAEAMDCVEYRTGLSIRYMDKPVVVSEGSVAILGAETGAQAIVKIYSPGNAVVDEFSVGSIAEMYHDEAKKCLKIVSRTQGAIEISCGDDAVLRSMYYNLVVRHKRRGDGVIDPVAQTQRIIRKAGEGVQAGGKKRGLDVESARSMELAQAIATQQDLLDKIADAPLSTEVRGDRAGEPHPSPHTDLLRRGEHAGAFPPGTRTVSPPRAMRNTALSPPHAAGALLPTSPVTPAPPPQLEPEEPMSYLLLGKRPSIRGSRRAVIVCCTYPYAPIRWEKAKGNAAAMQDLLKARGFGGEQVVLSDTDGAAEPTKANIVKALHWLVEGARAGDSLFLSFHGHGGDKADAVHGVQEGFCPTDFAKEGVLTGDAIRSALQLAHGVKLTMLCDLGTGGSVVSMPWSVARGQRGFHLADGGMPHALPGGTLLVLSALKDGCAGKESIVPAYARALNYHPEASAAQLLSAMRYAMQDYPVSPVLSSPHPVLASMHAGLGCLVTDFIDAVGNDRAALTAYHGTDVGCWQPVRALDTFY